jgi:hypothetical protein
LVFAQGESNDRKHVFNKIFMLNLSHTSIEYVEFTVTPVARIT